MYGSMFFVNYVHPNDDCNYGQSSNDVFPTAMHIAAYMSHGRGRGTDVWQWCWNGSVASVSKQNLDQTECDEFIIPSLGCGPLEFGLCCAWGGNEWIRCSILVEYANGDRPLGGTSRRA